MKISSHQLFHKRGANRKEVAHRPRKHDPNFAQSRDICEDRGERQIKQFPSEKYLRIPNGIGRQLYSEANRKGGVSR